MASAISSKRPRSPDAFGHLGAALAAASTPCVLLALRVLDFERIAWRTGRRAALICERRATTTFAHVARRTLRGADAVAHLGGSDVYVAALLGPAPRDVPRAARAVLAELAQEMTAAGFAVETGWTLYASGSDPRVALEQSIAAAFERGARERERSAFFAKFGHEMRSPLMSIDGFLEALGGSGLAEETRRRFLEIARAEAARLRRMVEGMYALSLLDLEADLPLEASCDAQRAIESACDAVYGAASRRGTRLSLKTRVDVALPMAHELAVGCFVALLENAVKHGRENGRIEIYVRDDASAAEVELWFDDDGDGIPDDEREVIFAPLVRGRDVVAPGSGLGLSIVRGTIERAGGNVMVARAAAGGARFIVRVPRATSSGFHTPTTMRSRSGQG